MQIEQTNLRQETRKPRAKNRRPQLPPNYHPITKREETSKPKDEPSAVACCVKEVGVTMVKGAATGAAQGAELARSSGIPEAAPATAVAGGLVGGAIGSAIGALGCAKCMEDAKKERELRAAKEEIEKLQREKVALEKAAADRAKADKEAADKRLPIGQLLRKLKHCNKGK